MKSEIRNKNAGPFLAFDEKWFRKHQKILIWLLNTPIIKFWFRWILRIRKYDCPKNKKINLILPNQFHYGAYIIDDKIKATADFRTHWKYSKRIYYAFKPFWWLLHFWDWLIADRFIPNLSFGLFTLTKSPEERSGINSCDGEIGIYNEAVATLEILSETDPGAGNYNSMVNIDSESSQLGFAVANSMPPNTWNGFYKAFFLFDTSSLSDANIADAVFSSFIYEYLGSSNRGIGKLGLYEAVTSNDNFLIIADYWEVIESTKLVDSSIQLNLSTTNIYDNGMVYTIYYLDSQDKKYYDFAFNASGLAAIDKTGTSKFAIHFDYNLSPTVVPYVYTYASGYMSEKEGVTQDPKLVINYTISSTNKIQMII